MITLLQNYKILINKSKKVTKYLIKINFRLFNSKIENFPKRIFSGIQPTGAIHLGNYLGAIKEWVTLQNQERDVFWSIVDMHAITLPYNVEKLRENIYKMTATLLACGIDPKKSTLFQQSRIPMHAELAWVLTCNTTIPKLQGLPQFKEKSEKIKDIPVGLFIYPLLQSADILLYKATDVPVGEDQLQHLHLAQHIVNNFNGKYGITFPAPKPIINKLSGRIKSLREPTKKMSKSSEYKKSCIFLIDQPETIFLNIKRAVTDFTSEVTFNPAERPGVSNLITIHSLITDKSPDTICSEVKDLNTGQYKLLLADIIIEKLRPIREEYLRLINDLHYLNEILKNGSLKAEDLAHQCWNEVKEKIGFSNKLIMRRNKYIEGSKTNSLS